MILSGFAIESVWEGIGVHVRSGDRLMFFR
jgi:hypothetical protein